MPTPFITLNQTSEITRQTTWTENDYKRYIERCRGFGQMDDSDLSKCQTCTAEFLNKYSWDDVLKYWDCENPDEIPSMSFTFEDGFITTSNLIDIIKEAMIDENCDGEIVYDPGCEEYNNEWEVVK